MNLSPSDLVARVADFFEAHPDQWGQGAFARTKELDEVGLYGAAVNELICQWCVMGRVAFESYQAVKDEAGNVDDLQDRRLYCDTSMLLQRALGNSMVASWNDDKDRTVEEVIDLCRRAATLEKPA